ncbi:hypothetical protein DL98DRAFT_610648 [Cadophora sp. DSE1049]|nr:hypothetical protein DL98DRAFT_610648 [Cadophora sp. DSE1049]
MSTSATLNAGLPSIFREEDAIPFFVQLATWVYPYRNPETIEAADQSRLCRTNTELAVIPSPQQIKKLSSDQSSTPSRTGQAPSSSSRTQLQKVVASELSSIHTLLALQSTETGS